MDTNRRRPSNALELVLRHRPETIGIQLDAEGWVDVRELLAALEAHGRGLTRVELEALVQGPEGESFELSPNGQRIRARR